MSAGKMAYQFNVRSDLFLRNVESKTVVDSCLVVLWTGFSVERSDELDTHTHTHTHSLPTNTDHYTAALLNTMSKLCDGIECRVTGRTGGSAKGEILSVQLGKEQKNLVKNRNIINKKRT